MRSLLVLVALILAFAAPAHAAPPLATLPFERFVLANGLEVIVHEDHRVPLAAVNVWYRVGFADDPPGKRGLAHLFEHLMLRGSKHVGRDKFFSTLAAAGASDRNATTSFDRTNYFETVPSNQLALALWLESDRMGFLLDMLDQGVLDKEKEVVRNEHRSGTLDAPYQMVHRFARTEIYPPGHPYRWGVEGEIEELATITLDDLRAFFRKYYVPGNASLVIAGDVERARVKELVGTYFASLPAGAKPKRDAVPALSMTRDARIEVEVGAETPRIMIGWLGPPAYTEDDARLALLSDVLAHAKSGRLPDALVRAEAIAEDAEAWSDFMAERLARIYWLKVELKKGADHDKALAAVDRVLDALRTVGPTTNELAEAKARREGELLWSLERVGRRADLLNAGSWLGGDPAGLDKTQRWSQASSPASLRDVVTRWLPKDRRVVVFVKPVAGAPVSGRLVTR